MNLMTDEQLWEFIIAHPVSGGCGTHGAENAAAADQKSFTSQMVSQASQVFGADNGVFNAMKSAYSNLLAAGPSQQGFSAAQQSAMDASAITSGANQARFVAGMVKGAGAGAGGGFATPGSSGAAGASLAGAEAKIAGSTASELNQIQQANWKQGNENWKVAGQGLGESTKSFSNVAGLEEQAEGGLKANMANAQAADAASNWWVKPVEGAVMGGISAFTGGMGGGLAKMALNKLGGSSGDGGGANSNESDLTYS